MNLKKVLSTSVASLTVLSTLSGSVSTKIYANGRNKTNQDVTNGSSTPSFVTEQLVYARKEPLTAIDELGTLSFFCDIKGHKFKIFVFYSDEKDIINFYENKEQINELQRIINNPLVGEKLKGKINNRSDVKNYCQVHFNGKTIEKISEIAEGLESTEAEYKNIQDDISSKTCEAIIDVITNSQMYKDDNNLNTKFESYSESDGKLQSKPDLEFLYDGFKYKIYCSETVKAIYPDKSKKVISLLDKIVKEVAINNEKSNIEKEVDFKINEENICHFEKILDIIDKNPEKIKGLLLLINEDKIPNGEQGRTLKYYCCNEKNKLHPDGKNSQNILKFLYNGCEYKIDCSKVAENYPNIMDEIIKDFSKMVNNIPSEKKVLRKESGEIFLTINNLNGLYQLETDLFILSQEPSLPELDMLLSNIKHRAMAERLLEFDIYKIAEVSIKDTSNQEKQDRNTKNTKTPGLLERIWESIKKFLKKIPLIGRLFK